MVFCMPNAMVTLKFLFHSDHQDISKLRKKNNGLDFVLYGIFSNFCFFGLFLPLKRNYCQKDNHENLERLVTNIILNSSPKIIDTNSTNRSCLGLHLHLKKVKKQTKNHKNWNYPVKKKKSSNISLLCRGRIKIHRHPMWEYFHHFFFPRELIIHESPLPPPSHYGKTKNMKSRFENAIR